MHADGLGASGKNGGPWETLYVVVHIALEWSEADLHTNSEDCEQFALCCN